MLDVTFASSASSHLPRRPPTPSRSSRARSPPRLASSPRSRAASVTATSATAPARSSPLFSRRPSCPSRRRLPPIGCCSVSPPPSPSLPMIWCCLCVSVVAQICVSHLHGPSSCFTPVWHTPVGAHRCDARQRPQRRGLGIHELLLLQVLGRR
ncbi:hypothetical protein PVAP13_9NG198550 [Panicum virgatum]|uniref:Uncharacterized protein n=1 Tax=Panicum virgatum TaxID=38727 RepID=A0A8T0MAM5_PANVG|nr:hypothetical protein PVAP13_9NG198550 [Panicum virgatum]